MKQIMSSHSCGHICDAQGYQEYCLWTSLTSRSTGECDAFRAALLPSTIVLYVISNGRMEYKLRPDMAFALLLGIFLSY